MFEKFEKIRRSGLKVLDLDDIAIILGLRASSARVVAARMVQKRILLHPKRNLYLLSGADVHDFEIANKLIVPSYISFESALHHWGITTQIPTIITSAARRSKRFLIDDREFLFSNLPAKVFNIGITRERTFFIAGPEKALLDMIYYAAIGRRNITFDTLDARKIDKKKFVSYSKRYPPAARKLAKEFL